MYALLSLTEPYDHVNSTSTGLLTHVFRSLIGLHSYPSLIALSVPGHAHRSIMCYLSMVWVPALTEHARCTVASGRMGRHLCAVAPWSSQGLLPTYC